MKKNFNFYQFNVFVVACVLGFFIQTVAITESQAQTLVAHWDFMGATPKVDLQGNFADLTLVGSGASTTSGGLNVTGTDGYAITSTYTGPTLTNKTLISWAEINDLTVRSGSILTIDRVSEDVFDGIVYAELEPQKWMNGSNGFSRYQALTHADATQTTSGTVEMMAITYQYESTNDIRMKVYRNGVLIGNYTKSARSSYEAGNTEAMFGIRHTNPVTRGSVSATIKEARIYDGVLTLEQIQALYDGGCDGFTVHLKDSNGDHLAGGSLEYREGGPNGWQAATEISDGVFCIDTERSRVGLRMTVSPQVLKVAKVPTSADYTFQMENVTVGLYNDGTPVDGGEVSYSSGGWHQFGSGTTGDDDPGIVTMDMLPTVYTFRMKYNGDKQNKREVISSSNNVINFDVADLKSAELDGAEDFQLVAYPNPFNGNATIGFSLEEAQEINISVYDQTGRLIEVLHDGIQAEGNHKISWDASEVNTGIYILRLSTEGQVVHQNIVKM